MEKYSMSNTQTISIERGKDLSPIRIGDSNIAPRVMANDVKEQFQNAAYKQTLTAINHNPVIKSMFNSQQAEFFARQLSYFYPNLLMKKYADLKFREFCPIVRGEAWDQLNVTQMYDVVGEVTDAEQMSGNLGSIGVSGEEQIDKIKEFQLTVDWTYSEFQADLVWNRIKQAKFFAMNRVFEQRFNNIFYYGYDKLGMNGILSDPTINTYAAAATGTGGSRAWADKTAAQQLEDIRSSITTLNSLANGRFNVRKIVMSLTQFNYVFGRPRSDYVDTDVFQYIKDNFPLLESIEGDAVLNGAGPSGSGVMILMDNETPDNYYMNIPLEKLPLPLFQKGTLMQFPFMSRATGLIVPYSNSINVVTSI